MVKAMNKGTLTGLGLFLLFLAGCEAIPEVSSNKELLSAVSTVSVNSQGFSMRPGDRIAWRRGIIWATDQEVPDSAKGYSPQRLQQEIGRQLRTRGYRVVTAYDQPQYHIVAAVVLGESDRGAVLVELSRLYPALGQAGSSLKKGTLMLGISNAAGDTLLWRSASEAFIAEEARPKEQDSRIKGLVSKLLKTLPRDSS
jgi:hypothetical protein